MAQSTRDRVRTAAEALGYVPSDRGRSLSTRRTGRIGVVVEELDNPFYMELLDALHERLDSFDARMTVLALGPADPERLEHLADGSIDGVVLTTTTLDSPLPGQLTRHGFPFVLLNRVVDDLDADSCSVDNHAGAAAVAQAMVESGHRRIGAIFGPLETSTGRDRELGFRAALADCGVPLEPSSVRRGRFSFADGQRHLRDLLAAEPRPTAVFCANDVVALGAHDATLRLGISVPEELSLVGFDDIKMSGWAAFALTTARQDLRRMVSVAVDLLLARLDDPHARAQQVVLPAELVRRRTLGPAAHS